MGAVITDIELLSMKDDDITQQDTRRIRSKANESIPMWLLWTAIVAFILLICAIAYLYNQNKQLTTNAKIKTNTVKIDSLNTIANKAKADYKATDDTTSEFNHSKAKKAANRIEYAKKESAVIVEPDMEEMASDIINYKPLK